MSMSTINQQVDGNGNTFSGSGDVHSNSFTCHGGTQNSAQGERPIGQQINNYYANPPPPPVIPRQLPALEPCFLHRDEELGWLNEWLHPGAVVAVCGPGGMGKSALAAKAVHQLEPARFPDGVVFHSFYHQPSTEQALQAICAAFQVEAKTDLVSAGRQALSSRRALLMLDGTEEAHDLPAILKLRGQCGVLITSRKRTDAQGVRLDLIPLEERQAEEVFSAYSGPVDDAASVAGICKILGGWPVALRIAGRYCSSTGESAATYLRFLAKVPFKRLGSGEHQEENAALLLRRSVEKVSGDAQQVLRLAGVLAFASIDLVPVMAVLAKEGEDRDELELRSTDALNELVNYGLMERSGERWQISHALIHTYARTELALSTDALERLAGWYIAFCLIANAEGVKGYARLDSERAHCLRLMESCLNSGLLAEVNNLAGTIDTYLDRQGYWIEELAALEMALAAARQAGKRSNEGWCLNVLGVTCWKRGEHNKALAYYEQSLVIRRELYDKEGESVIHVNIGNVYSELCSYQNAMHHLKQSLMINREVGNREGEGIILMSMGFLYDKQGDYEQALHYHEQGLSVAREIGHKILEGRTMNNIAEFYRVRGKHSKAIEYHQQALAICRELGDRAGEAGSCWNLGLTYKDMDDFPKAEEYIAQAVQIAEQISHPKLQTIRDGLARVRARRRG